MTKFPVSYTYDRIVCVKPLQSLVKKPKLFSGFQKPFRLEIDLSGFYEKAQSVKANLVAGTESASPHARLLYALRGVH